MESLPPLNALRCFLAAAEALSFKQAAEQLFVTQAAVSQQIRTLESHLGQKLFQRLNREVRLTKEGEILLPFVRQGFGLLEQGIKALRQDPNPNKLTVTVIPSFASRWLVPRLGRFMAKNPGLHVRLEPSLQLTVFEDNDIDVAIRFGKGQYPGLESHLLMNDLMFPVCHPDLLTDGELSISQLKTIPLLKDTTTEAWDTFFQQHRQKRKDFHHAVEIEDSNMLVEATLTCQGIAMVRHSLVYELLQKKQLVRPFPFVYQPDFAYYLVAPENHFQRQKVKNFEGWLREEIKEVLEAAEDISLQIDASLPR